MKGALPTSLRDQSNGSVGSFKAFMANAQKAHDAEVAALQSENTKLREYIAYNIGGQVDNFLLEDTREGTTTLRFTPSPRSVKPVANQNSLFSTCYRAEDFSADEPIDVIEPELDKPCKLEIGGASGPHARAINGLYEQEPDTYENSPMWRKRDQDNWESDAWLIRFSNGHWAVTNRKRMENHHPGGWIVSVDATAKHPAEVSKWQVNTGNNWAIQDTILIRGILESQSTTKVKLGSRSGSKTKTPDQGHVADDLAAAPLSGGTLTAGTSFKKPATFLEQMVESHHFDMFFGVIILLNAALMAVSMEYGSFDISHELGTSVKTSEEAWPNASTVFWYLEFGCGVLFTLEIVLKLVAMRRRFLTQCWNYLDSIIVAFWLFDQLSLSLPATFAPKLARLFRLAKLGRLLRLARAIEGFDALFLMTTALACSKSVLFWAFILMFFSLTFCSLILLNLLKEFYFFEDYPLEERQQVYIYFGTFCRAMFSMFELTLANWPPIVRVLAENVSEWFFLFGTLHKLVMGFAVVGVINGVFMQETFKVAAMDDHIMVRQKQRQAKGHQAKMKRLFKAADQDGSGQMSEAECIASLSEESVKMWLAAMDLDTSDTATLFRLIDTGDGVITCQELAAGVSRLKGAARSIDVYTLLRDIADIKAFLEVPDNIGSLSSAEHAREEAYVQATAASMGERK